MSSAWLARTQLCTETSCSEVARGYRYTQPMVGAVFLAACALRGPGLFWLEFWTAPVVRSLLVTVIVALLLWTLAGGWGVARRFSGSAADGAAQRFSGSATDAGRFSGSVWATGAVLAGLGAMLVAVGVVPAIAGTTHLGIPDSLPVAIMATGGVLLVVGGVVLAAQALRSRSMTVKSLAVI